MKGKKRETSNKDKIVERVFSPKASPIKMNFNTSKMMPFLSKDLSNRDKKSNPKRLYKLATQESKMNSSPKNDILKLKMHNTFGPLDFLGMRNAISPKPRNNNFFHNRPMKKVLAQDKEFKITLNQYEDDDFNNIVKKF